MNEELLGAYNRYINAGDYKHAYDCLTYLYERETYSMVAEFRKKIKRHISDTPLSAEESRSMNEILRNSYKLTARDIFRDFVLFVEYDRPIKEQFLLPRAEKLKDIIDALQQLEDGELDELFISQPARTGKSTVVMFYVIWIMLKHPEKSNLYCSYTDSVVGVFYNGILEVLNDTNTYAWAEVFPERKIVSTNAKDLLINIDRRKRYASFTGRSLYGTLNGACDCNGVAIADDMISGIEEAMNKDRLNAAWLKVDNNYLPRAKEGAKRLWIGTRWSVADPIARRLSMLEADERFASVRYKVVNVPALNENDESNFDYLFGVGFSTDYYHQRRASFERNNNVVDWEAQYMGHPIERQGTVFEPSDLRYYNGVLPEGDADRIFMVIDPAWGGGDYTAATINYQYGDDVYVADVVYNNGDKRSTQPEIVDKAIQYGVSAIYVEGTKMTASYGEDIDKMLRDKGYKVNVQITTKHFTGTGKAQRIFDKSVNIREQMIFLHSNKWSKEYGLAMGNLFAFTITGKNQHDDFADAAAFTMSVVCGSGVARMQIYKRPF